MEGLVFQGMNDELVDRPLHFAKQILHEVVRQRARKGDLLHRHDQILALRTPNRNGYELSLLTLQNN